MSQQVLHLDFIRLTPGSGAETGNNLAAAATALDAIDGVLGVGVLEADTASDFDVAFWFLLPELTALEPFGTDPMYARFLQGAVAPVVQGFAGADVKLEEEFECTDGPAACLALMGPDEAYDFEVRQALEAWSTTVGATASAIGLAVGEKQLYRGAAIAFGAIYADGRPDLEPFRATLIRGEARALGRR